MLTGWSHILNWQRIYITHFKTTTDRHDLCLGKYHGAHSIDAAVHGSLPRVKSLARACYMKRAVHPQKLQTGEISWSTMGFLGTPPCFGVNSILSVSIRRTPNDPRESSGGTGTIHHLESDQFCQSTCFVFTWDLVSTGRMTMARVYLQRNIKNLMPFAEQVRISTIKG